MTAPVTAAAGTLMSHGWALVFQAKDIGGDSCLPLSSFFCIYCSKNREYGLDITSLECLRHITIDPQLRLSILGPRYIRMLTFTVLGLTFQFLQFELVGLTHTRLRPLFRLFLLWILSKFNKFKLQLQTCKLKFSANAMKSSSFSRKHLQS